MYICIAYLELKNITQILQLKWAWQTIEFRHLSPFRDRPPDCCSVAPLDGYGQPLPEICSRPWFSTGLGQESA